MTFLGSSSAVPAIGHDNTFMALQGEQSTLLIDSASSPLLKLQMAGIDPVRLGYVILTHAHPDHIYGFPILMLGLWLLGHKAPLQVLAERQTLEIAEALLALFRPQDWPGFRSPLFREIALAEKALVLDLPDLYITGVPVNHLVPGIGLRILNKSTRRALVYSGDTVATESMARFARGADILVHEASGSMAGHSSAAQAGWVAQRAGVGKLFLIHYAANSRSLDELVTEAKQEFAGPVELALDLGTLEF